MSQPHPPLIAVTSNLISASAGTGKTYQLASRFVALLTLGYKAEEMIALTFTRKAAGEFRNRILKALSDGALDLNEKGSPRPPDSEGRPTGRNGITARVWETWSGLTIKEGKAVPAGNSVALCPASACVVHQAALAGTTPEALYAEDDELFARLQLPRLTAATYRHLLADVVNAMSRLTLSTLDSFFNRIVRGNSLTIGIRNIVPLEPEDVEIERRTVLRNMLASTSATTPEGQYFLQQYEKLTCGEGKNMMIYLNEQIQKYLTLYRNISSPQAWGNAETFTLESDITCDSISPEQWENYSNELNMLLLELIESNSKLAEKAKKAIPTLIKNLRDGKFSFLHKHVSATSANSGSAYNKFVEVPKSNEAEQLLATRMEDIVNEVRNIYMQAIINKTRSLFYILNSYATAYLRHMRSTGKVGFDDIAMFAYHLMKKGGDAEHRDYAANRITYNLDASYKHWMLDEFQDTSEMQFATLAPVLNEIAQSERHEETRAAERSIFVVGDEKQSIYGFRTGETEVFHKLQTETPWKEVLHPSGLEKSYRSSPEIMGENGFINKMFTALDEVENSIIREDNETLSIIGSEERLSHDARLRNTFSHHRSATSKAGYVRITAVPQEENNEDTRYAFYDSIAELLDKELTDDNGAPSHGMSIAILTRNNNEAEEIEERLKEKLPRLPLARLGDDKIAATSQLGELLLSFFLWMQHPDDVYRASLVKASPMGKLFISPSRPYPAAEKSLEYRQAEFRATHEYWLQQLENRGYAAVVHDLLDCFPTEPCNLRRGRTAHIWLTEAHAFDCSGGPIDEWLSRIGKAGTAAAASSRYVQIMTMHKSKGLEFDAVILPYISADAEDELSELGYFSKKDVYGEVEALLLNPGGREKRDAWKEVFEPLCAAKRQHARREAYNLLYVAATRAKHANYIFCNGASLIDEKQNNTSVKHWKGAARSTFGLLRRMLLHPPFDKQVEADTLVSSINSPLILWQSGNERWFEDASFALPGEQQEPASPLPSLPKVTRHRRRHVTPSTLAHCEDKRPPAHGSPAAGSAPENAGSDFGTAVHECFEQIIWLGEKRPDWLDTPVLPQQRTVAAALQQADVAALFTHAPGLEVYNEQTIEAISPANEWVSGSIDRLILTSDSSGKVTAAHIIDFKTNRPTPKEGFSSFYEWLLAHYAPQLSQYRTLIAAAFELPPQEVRCSLISCPGDGTPARVLTYEDGML
ncbi:MAG: UvrD-helicase domain-containing protein [Akkermansia sp.]|nr:UvrD-helicase domain-containing protein [Akkermansia sp.]